MFRRKPNYAAIAKMIKHEFPWETEQYVEFLLRTKKIFQNEV